jgi:hypothetical protein
MMKFWESVLTGKSLFLGQKLVQLNMVSSHVVSGESLTSCFASDTLF